MIILHWQKDIPDSLKTKLTWIYWRFGSYRAVNILRLGYKSQLFDSV
jgi:hypothetical protein